MIKICFVCTGNTCRSVMAERLMKKELKIKKIKDVKVCSKGLNAKGENIAENAKLALKEMEALSSNRKSQKLSKIDAHTIYVTMTNSQKNMINSKQVMSFDDLIGVEVPDPYGQNLDVYKQVALVLNEGVKVLVNKIIKWRS